jgi:hypothetical protein
MTERDRRADLAYKVSLTLGDFAHQYRIPDIVNDLLAFHDGDIDSVPAEEYTALIKRHERTVPEHQHRNSR